MRGTNSKQQMRQKDKSKKRHTPPETYSLDKRVEIGSDTLDRSSTPNRGRHVQHKRGPLKMEGGGGGNRELCKSRQANMGTETLTLKVKEWNVSLFN